MSADDNGDVGAAAPSGSGSHSKGIDHTPGPWSVAARHGRLKTEILCRGGGLSVATVWTRRDEHDRKTGHLVANRWPEGEANARLIAAAPDLFAALKTIVDFEASPDFSRWARIIDTARAVVSRAESRS